MIFIMENPFSYFKRAEIQNACTVIDRDFTASAVFRSIACQLSLGNPYHCDFDLWANYEILWFDLCDSESESLKCQWIEFCCEVHSTGFNAIWKRWPDDVSALIELEEDHGHLIGTYHHPNADVDVSIIDDVIFVIELDPDYQ